MADTTIVNTPTRDDSSAAGWVVALIILVAVILGGIVWYRSYGHPAAAAPTSGASVNVNIPAPTSGGTSGGGSTGGSTGY